MSHNTFSCDYLIIGAGIIGLSIARELQQRSPDTQIIIIEKEEDVAKHGSGRNSGVLHAGFYYSADSLKAKFTKEGNAAMHRYCMENALSLNRSQKVVVARNEKELETLYELHARAIANGVETRLIDEVELASIEPNAKTYRKALFSPNTSTINPVEVCQTLKNELISKGVLFHFNTPYRHRHENTVYSDSTVYSANFVINAAGLYADKIAKDFNFSTHYTILPFKGIYLKYTGTDQPIHTNIYPVPNLDNPFLGVHYTITVDGTIKIGPTAIPAFWRENYSFVERFNLSELISVLKNEAVLFITDAFHFRKLAFQEISKYHRPTLVKLALDMVQSIDKKRFDTWSTPGIRAQLLDVRNRKLVQDFVVEGDKKSLHILNAVSPAFTASFAFARWIVDHYVEG